MVLSNKVDILRGTSAVLLPLMSKMIFKAPNLLDKDFLQHRNQKFIKSPDISSVQDMWVELTLKQTPFFLI